MKARKLFLPVIMLVSLAACSLNFNQSNSNTGNIIPANSNTDRNVSNSAAPAQNRVENSEIKKVENSGKTDCGSLKKDDLTLNKKQTFEIDFKPFEKSCFATFHEAENDDPPLGAQFFIFQNGKEVFKFEPFAGGITTCWVNAVGFEDVNNDQLKDVIVAGECGAKMGKYNENMIYLNNGKEFVTNEDANAELTNFSKVSQISDYAKKHQKMFVP